MENIIKAIMQKKNELLNEFFKSSLKNANLHIEQDGIEFCENNNEQYCIEFKEIKVSPTICFKTSLSEDGTKYTLTKFLIVREYAEDRCVFTFSLN